MRTKYRVTQSRPGTPMPQQRVSDTASMKFGHRGERLTMVAAGGLGTKERLEHVETLLLERVHRKAGLK